MNNKKILENLIKQKAILISDYDKPFKLSSGEFSNYYYNSKNCMFDPEGLDIISDLLLKEVRKFKVKSVGGLETGSIPLVTAISLRSSLTESDPLSAFFVRKEPKKHGPQSDGPLAFFEGNPLSPIVIVDDVITTGKSVINKTLDRINRIFGVSHGLALGHLPDQPVAVLGKSDDRRSCPPPLFICNHYRFAAFHDSYHRVRSP